MVEAERVVDEALEAVAEAAVDDGEVGAGDVVLGELAAEGLCGWARLCDEEGAGGALRECGDEVSGRRFRGARERERRTLSRRWTV